MARPIRLGVPGNGLCHLPHHHPPRRVRQTASTSHAGAALRAHQFPLWSALDDYGGDCRGLPPPTSLQGEIAAALPSGWTMARAEVAVLSIGRLVVPFAEHAASCRQI